MAKKTARLFLVDGNSFCYRAYYAIRALSNSRGEPTNAIYGFITMMRKLVEDETPDYFAICFDRKEPTFRHERYEDYKAHRKPMPDDLVQQLEPIKEFCRAYRYTIFEKPGFEADDLLGTLARRGEEEGLDVVIVTGDKDAMQLVNERVKIMNPHKEDMLCDAETVRKKFDGLGPESIVDIMSLMGDASDNIPGVTGFGEKTAVKLIKQFGSLENLLANRSQMSSHSQRNLLTEYEGNAKLSKELARIDTEIPLEIHWDDLTLKTPDEDKLLELCKRYEFRKLFKESIPTGETRQKERRYEIIRTGKEFKDFIDRLKKAEAFSFDTETTSSDPMRAHIVGMSFSWEPFKAFYLPVACPKHRGQGLPLSEVLEDLKPILENQNQRKYGQNFKYDWIVMRRTGITLCGMEFDTMIASYLINPVKLNHNLDDISLEYLSVKKISTEALIGKGKTQKTMDEVPLEEIANYAAEDADCVFRLVPILRSKLEEMGLCQLFSKVEMPLMEVLARVEMNGVHLDTAFLKELSTGAEKDLGVLTKEIYEKAGEEFNINSPKQLADVLFGKMKLPVIKRTKTGYSTDVFVLEKLAANYDLPRQILEYREKSKLKSTYLDALPELMHPETRLIHTSYNQTATATGRLSSSEPNLQNIPVKTETGRRIRKAFIPRPRNKGRGKILSADYSQVELRILAHLSGDENLAKAFQEDQDIHRFTATLLYGVKSDEVTRQMRDVAKTINFSVIYGKTAFGLSQDLGISVSEADDFIQQYFKRYAGVRDYLETQKEKARENGYLVTILDRRSYFPEIQSPNTQLRQFAERAAINAPIQGSAADLIKLAMVTIQKRLEKEYPTSLMIMQVHDELVFDIPENEAAPVSSFVQREMENAYQLRVPLKVDIHIGDSWFKN